MTNNFKLTQVFKKLFFLLFVILEIIILGLPSILFPFGRDQATGAYVAKLWLNGKLPYLYAVEVRPPANYIPFLLANFLFENMETGIRILDMGLVILISVILFLIGEFVFNWIIGIISSFIFPILYYGYFDFWHSCQMESWQIAFISIGIYFYFKNDSKKSRALWFLTGISFGISFLFKFTSLLFFIVLFLSSIFEMYNRRQNLFFSIKNLLFFLIGFFSPILICIYYFYSHGAFDALKEVLYDFVILGYSKQSIPIDWDKIKFPIVILYILWLIFIILGLWAIFLKTIARILERHPITHSIRRKMGIILWVILAIIIVIWQGKYYFYHLLVCIPPFVFLISAGIYFSFRLILKIKKKVNKIIFLLILFYFSYHTFFSFFVQRFEDWKKFLNYSMNSISKEEYYRTFKGPHDFNYEESYNVGKFIEENSLPTDTILFLGYDPVVYLSANRESASRFYSTHLIFNFYSPVRSKWIKDYFETIFESRSLRYIIVPHWEIDFIEQISSGIYRTEIIEHGILPSLIPKFPGEMFQIQPIGVRGPNFTEKTQIGKFLIFEKRETSRF